ncbi:MAG: mechanosensitive ion channel family protein, partial [Calditrichia bacterium]
MDIEAIMSKIEQIMHFTLFTLNRTPITPMSIILFIVMFTFFVLISRMIKKLFEKKIFNRLQMDESIGYSLVRVSQYLVMSIGIIVSFQFVGIDLSGLAVIFGLLSVGIGFGLQTIVANFIAGLVLLFERPIRVGDRITVGETEGDVLEINLRSTTVKSLNNISIIVPNSEFISTNVINWSHGDQRVRLDLPVGVSYNSDLDLV